MSRSSEDDNRGAISDPDLRNIYLKMIDYLSRGDMSEARLVDRITRLKKYYPRAKRYERYTAENAWKVIPLLRDQGSIDEERYARRLFDFLKDKRDGLRVIRRKMLTRQIRPKLVGEILSEFENSGSGQNREQITRAARTRLSLLQKKFGSHPKKKFQIRSKLYSWLVLRGFSTDEIAKISREIKI